MCVTIRLDTYARCELAYISTPYLLRVVLVSIRQFSGINSPQTLSRSLTLDRLVHS